MSEAKTRNFHTAEFCVDCLEEALRRHGKPEIFNSDQGSQFTSDAFTGVLKREGITISMDGRGRAFDNIFVERLWRNVKHEDVYLKGYATMIELTVGLAPILFMTALDSVADKVAGFEAGGVDYITKPFQQVEVLARVMPI
jgi:transposase InsO family protein